MAGTKHRPNNVGREGPTQPFDVHAIQPHLRLKGSRVVYEGSYRSEFFGRSLEQFCYIGLRTYIGPDRNRPAAGLLDFFHHGLSGEFIA